MLAPLNGSDQFPSRRGFYFQASGRSVTLPAAGYDCNSDRTPLLAGLAPVGMAASFAAREPSKATHQIVGALHERSRHGICGHGERLTFTGQVLSLLFRLCSRSLSRSPVVCVLIGDGRRDMARPDPWKNHLDEDRSNSCVGVDLKGPSRRPYWRPRRYRPA